MLAALVLALPIQDVPPPPPLPEAPARPAEPLDVDGAPLAPGRLPASTTAQARSAFERILSARTVPGEPDARVTAFDLALDLRLRASERQTNELPNARYAYLEPGYLLADTGKGQMHLRGPKGDWLVDTRANPGRALVRLEVGRENAEDRRQIEDAVDVARLFVGLIDPRALRVQKFAQAEVPAGLLPPAQLEAARKLAWFELATPDVRPGAGNATGARLLLGTPPEGGLPSLVIADDVRAPAGVNPTTSCVLIPEWRAIDGWSVPRRVQVFLPQVVEVEGAAGARSTVARGWREHPAMDLVVKSGSLKPRLVPADFEPPAPEQVPSGG